MEHYSEEARSDQRPKLACELRSAGKSFFEIGQILKISRLMARQFVHKYEWSLRQRKSSP